MENEIIRIIIASLSLAVNLFTFLMVHRNTKRYNKIMKEYRDKILER